MIELKGQYPVGHVMWDEGDRASVKGLHVRWRAEGKASYMFRHRDTDGTQRRRKLGDTDQMTLGMARALAKAMPERLGAEKAEEPEPAEVPTIGELFAEILEKYWGTERFIESDRKHQVQTIWRKTLETRFGSLPYTKLSIGMIKTWKDEHASTIYEFNRAKEILGVIFKESISRELIPMTYQNPCKFVKDYVEKKRKVYAGPEELKAMEVALKKYEILSPRGVAYIRLMMLTGSRPLALEKAMRSELKVFENDGVRTGVLTFRGKTTAETGDDEQLMFTSSAMAIVDYLAKLDLREGRTDGKLVGCKNPVRLWRKIRAEIGNKNLWLRDLRRSYATVGISKAGVGKDSIGGLLNHRSPQTTDRYAMYMVEHKLEAAEKIDKAMQLILH